MDSKVDGTIKYPSGTVCHRLGSVGWEGDLKRALREQVEEMCGGRGHLKQVASSLQDFPILADLDSSSYQSVDDPDLKGTTACSGTMAVICRRDEHG